MFYFYLFIFLWPHSVACGISVPWPGIEATLPAVEVRSLSHRTAREVPRTDVYSSITPDSHEAETASKSTD